MDVLTYVLIVACYSLGCGLCYWLGRNHGEIAGIQWASKEIVRRMKSRGLSQEEVEILILNKALKSAGS